ncbi:MAG: SDR family NAD(P)-dependent oxidoreductase, partial [Clostridia bacterium]|nr:SDR family NAD(P)-dependent oxidoreductase [Clostridia bacterium]
MQERKETNAKKFALITGATGGLGKAFVTALAKRGYGLLLTGRSADKLQALASETNKTYGVEVRYYPADLANEGDRYAMMEKIAAENLRISLLAN